MKSSRALSLAALLLTFGLASCAMHYNVPASAAAVGADAKIEAKEEQEQGLTRLTMRIENLAPPERVSSGATSFVAWQRVAADKGWVRIGGLRYNEGDRTAVLDKATVPALGFALQVTAEITPAPTAPSNVVVISQKVGG